MGSVQRFLSALESDIERKLLAPIYLREIVFRLLRSEQRTLIMESAAREIQGNAVITAICFMKQEMHRPMTVRDLANAVNMSESAFAHVFKATTGAPPLRFLKQIRLEHANKFLLSGSNVSEAAEIVSAMPACRISFVNSNDTSASLPKFMLKSYGTCTWRPLEIRTMLKRRD